jgi:hypothetical protein
VQTLRGSVANAHASADNNAPEKLNDAETMTPLGTARTDNSTTTTGAHAYEKAMGPLAANDGGLVSTFHDNSPSEKRKP